MDKNDKKSLIIFFVLTFVTSWSIWFFSGILFRKGSFIYNSQWLFAQTGVSAPTVIAMIFTGLKTKEFRIKNGVIVFSSLLIFITDFLIKENTPSSIQELDLFTSASLLLTASIVIAVIFGYKYFYLPNRDVKTKNRISFKWVLTSLFFLPFLFVVGWLLTGGRFEMSVLWQDAFIKFTQVLFLAFSMNLILGGSMGEEFGWRGYALPILFKNYIPTAARKKAVSKGSFFLSVIIYTDNFFIMKPLHQFRKLLYFLPVS